MKPSSSVIYVTVSELIIIETDSLVDVSGFRSCELTVSTSSVVAEPTLGPGVPTTIEDEVAVDTAGGGIAVEAWHT